MIHSRDFGGDDVPPQSVLDYLAKRHRFVHRSNCLYELRLRALNCPKASVSWPHGVPGAPEAICCKLIGTWGISVGQVPDRDT